MNKKCTILVLLLACVISMYGQATITIPKTGKSLLVENFNNKKLEELVSFKVINKRAKGSPVLTITTKDGCPANVLQLTLPSLDVGKEHVVQSSSITDSMKVCFKGTPLSVTVVLGKDSFKATISQGTADSDSVIDMKPGKPPVAKGKDKGGKGSKAVDAPIFIPDPAVAAKWRAAAIDRCDKTLPMLNKHTRWAFEYNCDCDEDPVRILKRKWDGTVVEATGFRPLYDRHVLILVKNLHPYKDSVSLGITYSDRFLEHAGIFTTAFNTTIGTSPTEEEPDDSTAEAADALDDLERFTKLRDELKSFYERTRQSDYASRGYLESAIRFINKNIEEGFGIIDITPEAIVNVALDKVDDLPDDVDAKDFVGKAREAARYYKLIISYHIFIPHSILIQNRDEITMELNRFVDKKKITTSSEASRTYNVSGGVKVDFSLGIFATGLIDKSYTTVAVSRPDTTFLPLPGGGTDPNEIVSIDRTATKDSIIRDDRGSFAMGPAVFSHLYWRTGKSVNLGLTFGFSLDQQATPRYLFGGSLMLGTKQRLALNGGWAFGQRKQLAAGLKEGQLVTISSYPSSTLPSTEKTDHGWFLSISFNFGGFAVGAASDQ